MHIVNDDNFDTEVLEHSGVVLAYFTAKWCGPCRQQGPILEKWSEDNSEVKVVKVDVDENKSTSKYYNIKSIPTLIAFKDGKELASKAGLTNYEQINNFIKTNNL